MRNDRVIKQRLNIVEKAQATLIRTFFRKRMCQYNEKHDWIWKSNKTISPFNTSYRNKVGQSQV